MVNKHYQKHKEKLRKEAHERYQYLSEEEKGEKRPETYTKISLKKKKKKSISIIVNV